MTTTEPIPRHELWWQWGCDGTHIGCGAEGCPRNRHHHHDERCDPPPIVVLLAIMAGVSTHHPAMRFSRA